ncbi:MAG: hypothetical protein ACLUNZ_08910 [Evtepia sp.]
MTAYFAQSEQIAHRLRPGRLSGQGPLCGCGRRLPHPASPRRHR